MRMIGNNNTRPLLRDVVKAAQVIPQIKVPASQMEKILLAPGFPIIINVFMSHIEGVQPQPLLKKLSEDNGQIMTSRHTVGKIHHFGSLELHRLRSSRARASAHPKAFYHTHCPRSRMSCTSDKPFAPCAMKYNNTFVLVKFPKKVLSPLHCRYPPPPIRWAGRESRETGK